MGERATAVQIGIICWMESLGIEKHGARKAFTARFRGRIEGGPSLELLRRLNARGKA